MPQKFGFIFPNDYFNLKKVDPDFAAVYAICKDAGYATALLDQSTCKAATALTAERYFYKGWMLNPEDYISVSVNVPLMVNPDSYLASHHITGWYSKLKDYTFETLFTDNPVKDFVESGWQKAILKDYVKSLNTGAGSVITDAESISAAVQGLKKYRGTIEGGLVLRQFEDIKPETERRFFVLDGIVYGARDNLAMFSFAQEVSQLHTCLFYSLDIVEDFNGQFRVVEIGDGQVSDFKEWDIPMWVKMFDNLR
jgi:hypothetical protein